MEKNYFPSYLQSCRVKGCYMEKRPGGLVMEGFCKRNEQKNDAPKVYKLCNSLESRLDSVSANCLNHKLLVLNSQCTLGKRCSIQGT